MLDSLWRDYAGAFGNDWIKTLNINKLASEGVRFVNTYLESLPVRRVLSTGKRTFPCRYYKAAMGDVVLVPGW